MPTPTYSARAADDASWPGFMRAEGPAGLCAYLSLSKHLLYSVMRNDPTFPPRICISTRCLGWRREAIDAWLEAKEHPAAEAEVAS